jgi:hypothetical protein
VVHVQAITLRLSPASEELFLSKAGTFCDRPQNMYRRVVRHIGLAVYCLPPAVQESVKIRLTKMQSSFFPVTVTLGPLQKIGPEYFGFAAESPNLIRLHELVTTGLKPVVAGYFNRKYLNHRLSNREKRYLYKSGYHRIKEFYHPHITLGKYATTAIRDAEFELAPRIDGRLCFTKLLFDDTVEGSAVPARILWETTLQ